MSQTNFDNLESAVGRAADKYEEALESLTKESGTATSAAGPGTASTMSISDATKASTQVSIAQAVTDFTQGIAKNAADHVKKQGGKLGQG